MPSLSIDNINTRIAAMLKGEHGTGKSIAASSFPRPHFFFFEQRWKSLATYWLKNNPAKINEITYDDLSASSYYNIIKAVEEQVRRPMSGTLVLDSITSGGDVVLGNIKKGKDADKGKVISGIKVNDGEDFSAEDAFFKDLKDITFNFPGHVIWIAHVLIIEQQNMMKGTTTISRPIVSGAKKIAAKLPVYFDEVWHSQVSSGRYQILTKHAGTDYAKTSLPISETLDFTDGSLYDLIQADLAKNFKALVDKKEAKEKQLASVIKI